MRARHHLLLALDDVDVERVVQRVGHHVLLERLLRLLGEVALRLELDLTPRPLALLHPVVELLPRLDGAAPLVQLLLARLAVRVDRGRQPGQGQG